MLFEMYDSIIHYSLSVDSTLYPMSSCLSYNRANWSIVHLGIRLQLPEYSLSLHFYMQFVVPLTPKVNDVPEQLKRLTNFL